MSEDPKIPAEETETIRKPIIPVPDTEEYDGTRSTKNDRDPDAIQTDTSEDESEVIRKPIELDSQSEE